MKLPILKKALALFNNYSSNLIIKRFLSILGVDVLVKVSGFILLPIYLRLMEQEEFGHYNYLISIIATFSLVLNFGLYVSQSKLYHQYETPEKRGSAIFSIFAFLTVLLVIVFTALILFRLDFTFIQLLFKKEFNYASYRWILLPSLFLTVYTFMFTNFLYTSEKIKVVKKYNVLRILLTNGLAMLALCFISYESTILRLGFTYLAELILLAFFAQHLWKELVFKLDKRVIRQSFKIATPIMLSAFFGIFINFSDKFFIEKYGSATDLSNYYLSFSFAGIITLLFSSLQNIWLPLFLKEKDLKNNIRKTKKMISRIALFLVAFSICIWLLFFFMLSFHIIPAKYAEGKRILPLLLITQIISTITLLLGNYFVYFEKTYSTSITGLFITFLTLGLSLLFVPRFGMYGAIIVNLVSNVTYAIIYFFWVRYYIRKSIASNLNEQPE